MKANTGAHIGLTLHWCDRAGQALNMAGTATGLLASITEPALIIKD